MQSTVSIEQLPVEKDLSTRLLPLGPGAVLGCSGSLVAAASLGRLMVRARLVGPVAAVEVIQAFQNNLSEAVEFYYLFPLSSNASVSRFRVQVGARVCEMQVVPREQAANLSRTALPGFLSALLGGEYQSVFCVPLGVVQPQETIQVDLAYAEVLSSWSGDCRFTFPLMMSGRFQSGASLEPSGESPVSLAPGVSAGPNLAFSVAMEVAGSPPIRLASSHPLVSQQMQTGELGFELARQDLPPRDFTLTYRFGQEKNPQGILRQGRQHFLYHLHSPQASPPSTLPRHLILLMDVSENATGRRLEVSRQIAAQLLNSLGPGENFSLVGFNNQLTGYETGIACDKSHVPAALQWLQNLKASGRADMSIILERVLQLPVEPGRGMVVALLVCGRVGNEPELYSTLTSYQPTIRFNCIGIDQAVNPSFLRRLSGYTRGQPVFVGEAGPDEMTQQKIVQDTRVPLLQDLQLVDQGLGINAETFTPGSLPGLGASDVVTIMGLKAGTGGIEARARSFSGQPWIEAVAPLVSQNPAIGVAWAHLKAREMSDELKLITGPRASRLRDVSAALARDYRLVGDSTASVLTDPGAPGGAIWLPSLVPSEWKPEEVVDLTKNTGKRVQLPPPPPIEDLPPKPPGQDLIAEPGKVNVAPVEPAEEQSNSGLTMKAVIQSKAKHQVKNKLHGGMKKEANVKPILGSGKVGVGGKPVLRPGGVKAQVQEAVDEGPKRLPVPNRKEREEAVAVEEPPPPPPAPPPATPPPASQPGQQPPTQAAPPPQPADSGGEANPEAVAKQLLNSNTEFRQATMADLKVVYQTLTRCAQAGGAVDPQLLPLLERILRRLQPLQPQSTLVKEAYRIGVLCYQALRGQDPQGVAKTQHWVQRFAKLF